MTNEKSYSENCPSCHTLLQRRKRDLGKECNKCAMSKIGLAYAEKRRQNPTAKTSKEYNDKSKEKRFENDPLLFRLNRTFYACKHRAKKNGVPFEITVQDLIDMFPTNNLCPVLGISFVWGTKKNHNLSPSLDRMIPAKGYVKGNLKFISYKANRIKNDSTVEILKNLIEYMKA